MAARAATVLLQVLILVSLVLSGLSGPSSDADLGRMELRRVRVLAAQPRYGECWARALKELGVRCKDMTSESQRVMALRFTQCHLSSSGRDLPACPVGSDVSRCTGGMDAVAFNTFTEFFTHTHAICHFLQSEAWQSRAEDAMSKLTETSAGVAEELQSTRQMAKDLLEAQSSALQAQEEILSNGEELRGLLRDSTQGLQSVFLDLSRVSREQQGALSELFHRVSFLQSFLMMEAHSLSSCCYNAAAFCTSFLITSTPRSSRARLILLCLVCLNFYLERKIYEFVVSSEHPEHLHMELLSVYVGVLRRLMVSVGVCVLLLVCVRYRDPVQQSLQILQQLREMHSSLQEALQRAERCRDLEKKNVGLHKERRSERRNEEKLRMETEQSSWSQTEEDSDVHLPDDLQGFLIVPNRNTLDSRTTPVLRIREVEADWTKAMEKEEDGCSCLNSGSAAFRTSALHPLREYIKERLAAAAEEIFRQVEKTFIQFDEGLCGQRRLLEISWKRQLQLQNISLPQHHHLSADKEQRNQERSSRGKRREPEPPCVKEEWEEVFISQDAKQPDLKQEDVFMQTPTPEERRQTPASHNSHQLQTQDTSSEETELKNTDQRNRGDRDQASFCITGSQCSSSSEEMSEDDICAKDLKIKTLVEKHHKTPVKSVENVTCVMSGPPQKLQENVSVLGVHPVTAFSPPAAPLPPTVPQPVQRNAAKSIGLLQPVGLINGQVVFKSLNPVYLAPTPAAPLLNACSFRTKRPIEQQFKSQPYIKKPPNAFMLFLKEQRAAVPPELKSNSSAVNKLLGEKWSLLSEEQKAKYFNQADEEKRLHAQQHPDWSSSDNYGKKKRISRKGAPSKIEGLNVLPGSIHPCAPL